MSNSKDEMNNSTPILQPATHDISEIISWTISSLIENARGGDASYPGGYLDPDEVEQWERQLGDLLST